MLEIDTTELDNYARFLKNKANELQRRKEEWFYLLMNSPKVKLEGRLRSIIDSMVYMDRSNTWYERTGRLNSKEAINIEVDSDGLSIYMNDKWLDSEAANDGLSKKTGYAPEAHTADPPKSYSERVEEGWEYKNTTTKEEEVEPRPFMKTYFNEMVSRAQEGKLEAYEIIRPLFEGWR
ncbi:MAG: hypothetical protein ACOC1X_00200 [Promethearchaeota archaeon]